MAALGKEYPPQSSSSLNCYCVVGIMCKVIYTIISPIFHHSPMREDTPKLRKWKLGEIRGQITLGRNLDNKERSALGWETCKSHFRSNNILGLGQPYSALRGKRVNLVGHCMSQDRLDYVAVTIEPWNLVSGSLYHIHLLGRVSEVANLDSN